MSTLVKIKCEECKVEISGHRFKSHLKNSHLMTPEDYYKKHLQLNPKEGTCIHCAKPTAFVNVFQGYRTYCSATCCSLFKKGRESEIVKTRLIEWKKRIRLDEFIFVEPRRSYGYGGRL